MALYLPASLTNFDLDMPLAESSLACFALLFDIVHTQRPQLSVAVNTPTAESFFIACHAITRSSTDGIIYAATDWSDKQQFTDVQQYARQHYPSISYMLHAAEPVALSHFAQQSVDCVIIDSSDLSDAELTASVHAWSDKLHPAGLLIAHHQTARSAPAATASQWQHSITLGSESLQFFSSTNPLAQESALNQLFSLCIEGNGVAFYQHIGQLWSHRIRLAKQERLKQIRQLKQQLAK